MMRQSSHILAVNIMDKLFDIKIKKKKNQTIDTKLDNN